MRTTTFSVFDYLPASVREFPKRRAAEMLGIAALAGVAGLGAALLTWSVEDPSLNHATNARVHNLLGGTGAIAADIVMQMLGLACIAALAPPAFWGWRLLTERRLASPGRKAGLFVVGIACAAALASLLPAPGSWPLPTGLGGVVGDALLALPRRMASHSTWGMTVFGAAFAVIAILALTAASGFGFGHRPESNEARQRAKPGGSAGSRPDDEDGEDEPGFGIVSIGAAIHGLLTARAALRRLIRRPRQRRAAADDPVPAHARAAWSGLTADDGGLTDPAAYAPRPKVAAASAQQAAPDAPGPRVAAPIDPLKPGARAGADAQLKFAFSPRGEWTMPPLAVLAEPKKAAGRISNDALEQNARMLEGVLDDF